MKHRIVHAVQKYVLNPPIKLLFALGVVPPGYALLETTGRKTGKPRRTPVGDGRIGGQFWIVAEHGMNAGYVRNIACNPCVRLKLQGKACALAGTAGPRTCCQRTTRVSVIGGLPVNCRVVPGMHGQCGFSVLTVRIDLDA
jgi:hypothetical protein